MNQNNVMEVPLASSSSGVIDFPKRGIVGAAQPVAPVGENEAPREKEAIGLERVIADMAKSGGPPGQEHQNIGKMPGWIDLMEWMSCGWTTTCTLRRRRGSTNGVIVKRACSLLPLWREGPSALFNICQTPRDPLIKTWLESLTSGMRRMIRLRNMPWY